MESLSSPYLLGALLLLVLTFFVVLGRSVSLKVAGGSLILIGIGLGIYGLQYEVGVTIDGDNMRRGSELRPLPEALRQLPPEWRPSDPTRATYNLSLAAHRQSILLGSAVSLICGVMLLGFGQVIAVLRETRLEMSSSSDPDFRSLHRRFIQGKLTQRSEFIALARHAGAQGLDVNAKEAKTGLSMLHVAAGLSDVESVRALLSAGADRVAKDARARTPSDMTQDAATLAALSGTSERPKSPEAVG